MNKHSSLIPERGPRDGRDAGLELRDGPSSARELLRLFWRRKWMIAAFGLFFASTALVVVANQTPLYTAKAVLMLNTRQSNVVDVDAVLSALPANATQVLNEIEMLQSGRLLVRVIDDLALEQDAEFNTQLREESEGFIDFGAVLADAKALLSRWAGEAPERPVAPPLTTEEDAALVREQVLGALRERLKVGQEQYSLAISVAVTSESPQKAARIANAIADQYLADQLEAKFGATRRASDWLNTRLTELKAQVASSEAKVEAYKASRGAGTVRGASLTSQQLTQLNAELALARAKRAEAEARHSRIAEILATRGPFAAADAISSPLIQSLRQQLAELRRSEAELATRYTAKHPKMINLKAEISDTGGAIATEVRKTVSGLRTELEVAISREAALEQSVQGLEEESLIHNQSAVELRQLEREAEANRLIYESFLARLKETEDQDGLQQPDAELISRAETPARPSFPDPLRAIALSGIGGLIIGVLMALLLEQLDNAYRSARQIEQDLDLATLGATPRMRGRRNRRAHLDHVIARPTSPMAEAFRSLRSALFLTNVDAPPKVAAVVSATPGEGKSTVATLLAQASTRLGKRVLLVDCDLRRPTLSEVFSAEDEKPGLVELLAGSAGLDEAIFQDRASGIDFIASRVTSASAVDLLSSQRFADLIDAFRARYDMVVLDAAPTLAVSDSVPIALQADAVLFVVKWNGPSREAVQAGVKALTDRGVKVDGVVLSQVELNAEARYGYGQAPVYYGRFPEYCPG